MANIVYDTLMTLMPGNRKSSSSGWVGMNGVCCVHNGETPDTRRRLSITMGSKDDACLVACFNCKFKAIWKPGQLLGRKMKNFLGWMGMADEEIRKLSFKIWQEKEIHKLDPNYAPVEIKPLQFPSRQLPLGSKLITQLLAEGCIDPNFIKVLTYLDSRGDELLSGYDYYWTPSRENDLNQRIIIPFKWKGEIVGWTARATFPTKNRYFSEMSAHYLFNTEVTANDWQYVFVCEGPFDGIAINGIAALGDKLSEEQIQWLNRCGKRVVVIPDQQKAGGTLVDVAVKQNWYVSFPSWDQDVKDAADAVKRYGKLYTVWSIIDAMVQNRLEINVRRQRLK